MTDAVLFWGFQGTIDYRATLTDEHFEALNLELPAEDQERFVDKDHVLGRLARLRLMDVPVATAPGGSPLVSALAASDWLHRRGSPVQARFVGARPAGIDAHLAAAQQDVVSLAAVDPAIGGTLALEYRPSNSKLMLSVPGGRWLDETLADRGLNAIRQEVAEQRPRLLVTGIGGLNKASLRVVRDVIPRIRALADETFLIATGSSFRQDVTSDRPRDFWDDLFTVLGLVDMVSVSSAEGRQLAQVWGAEWPQRLLDTGGLSMLVTHSSKEAKYQIAPTKPSFNLDAALEAARTEASAYAAKSLTGLGARFDGVLSAALLSQLISSPLQR